MNTPDTARLFVAFVASIAFLMFAVRINDDWSDMNKGWRVTRLSILGLIFSFAFASVELMTVEPRVPIGARNVMIPFFLVGLLIGLWMVRKYPLPPNNAVSSKCTFPGCIIARGDLRALAEKYPAGIPPHLVLAIVESVEAHEHQ